MRMAGLNNNEDELKVAAKYKIAVSLRDFCVVIVSHQQ
jgi:hypothetical protein